MMKLEDQQYVLGCILVQPDVLGLDSLKEYSMWDYSIQNRLVLMAIWEVVRLKGPVDIVTVSQWLEEHKLLGAAGGRPYINDLALAIEDVDTERIKRCIE
jgi:replicative DNA helicase